MGKILRSKGWKRPIWMQVLVVFAWFGCMFIGSFAYAIYITITKGEAAVESIGFSIYPIALFFAVAGVGIVFLIAKLLPNKIPPPLPGAPDQMIQS